MNTSLSQEKSISLVKDSIKESIKESANNISQNENIKDDKKWTPLEQRALKLLGSGQNQEITAKTLGVSPSRISQLMSNEEFAREVQNIRFNSSQRHIRIDERYDSMEEKLQRKLENRIDGIVHTKDILKALKQVNEAKRKTVAEPESINTGNRVITLVMPVQVLNSYAAHNNPISTNDNKEVSKEVKSTTNQVLEIDGQSLITIPSEKLNDLAATSKTSANEDSKNKIRNEKEGQRISKADLE